MTILDDSPRTIRPIFSDVSPAPRGGSPLEPLPRDWTWINWMLSLMITPIAAVAMAFALTRMVGTALCSSAACPRPGVNGALFNLLYYGPVVVAALTLFFAFFFATRRFGIAVWAGGWALVSADLMVVAVAF